MSFQDKFMKLPQKLRVVIVGAVLVVIAVPVIGLLIFLKHVLPEGKASAKTNDTTSIAASPSARALSPSTARPTTTTPKRK